jgi:hypothetical protein
MKSIPRNIRLIPILIKQGKGSTKVTGIKHLLISAYQFLFNKQHFQPWKTIMIFKKR